MNAADAVRLGLNDGDRVRVTPASNPEGVWDLANGSKVPMVGKGRVVQGMRSGVVGFSLGHGHWAYGGRDVMVDGKTINGDLRRTAAMHRFPYLVGACHSRRIRTLWYRTPGSALRPSRFGEVG